MNLIIEFLWNKRTKIIGIGVILILLLVSCGSSEANSTGILFPRTDVIYVEGGDSIAIEGIPQAILKTEMPVIILFDSSELQYFGHLTVEEDISLYILCSKYSDKKRLVREYFLPQPKYSNDNLVFKKN